jgi:AbrB family looped-hinge helix DNA binding protein
MRVTRRGQVSIPAGIRRRWGTSTITLEDLGDRLVLEPAADDPISAAEGALTKEFGAIDQARLRRVAREIESRAQTRRKRDTP